NRRNRRTSPRGGSRTHRLDTNCRRLRSQIARVERRHEVDRRIALGFSPERIPTSGYSQNRFVLAYVTSAARRSLRKSSSVSWYPRRIRAAVSSPTPRAIRATTAFFPWAMTRLAFVKSRFAFDRLSLSVPPKSSFATLSFSYGAMTATMSASHRGQRIFAGKSRTVSRHDILQFRHRKVAVSFSRRAFTS